MTRINCVPVDKLIRQHLIAEYRELPRVFGAVYNMLQAGKSKAHDPNEPYKLGKGHVLFFYTRLKYLSDRHHELVNEMLSRGYVPAHNKPLWYTWAELIPQEYWNDWTPTIHDQAVNWQRIVDRMLGK